MRLRVLALVATLGWASHTLAGGYEKAIMFSGQYAGIAGAASSSVMGSEALYWNPAGLTNGQTDMDVSLNLSPTQSQFTAPVLVADETEDSTAQFSPIFGVTYRYALSEDLGLGVGYYVSGGTTALFEDATNTGTDHKTDLSVSEFAVGLGYKINEKLSLGLALRGAMVTAAFQTSVNSTNYYEYTDGTATAFNGYKLGLQYQDESFGFGVFYRSRMTFTAEGSGLCTGAALGCTTADEEDFEVTSELPQQIGMGANFKLEENWNGFMEMTWTNYEAIRDINFIQNDVQRLAVDTNWNDQLNLRLAGEYLGWGLPFRFGYILTTNVTPVSQASETFSTPGWAHSFLVGAGGGITDNIMWNFTLEYSLAAATVLDDAATQGDYSSSAVAGHFGFTFNL